MNYFQIQEENGRAAYQLGDTNCPDCNQLICACESLADWHRERDENLSGETTAAFSQPRADIGSSAPTAHKFGVCSAKGETSTGDVRVPAPVESPTSFSAWLDAHGDSLPLPQSFTEWLDQNGDAI